MFLAIPIYWSGLVAFYKKNPNFFLFPLLAVAIYVFIGLAVKDNKGWHPYWLILLEAPVYYVACWLVKTLLKEEEPKEEVKPEVEPEPELETQPKPEVVPVVNPEPVVKPKKQISHRREKLASKPKEKKVKVVTEDKNYNKKKSKVKLKADISHNPDYKENAEKELNNEE